MATAPRGKRRLLTLSATAGIVVATTLGLFMPNSAQAGTPYQTKPEASFWCYSNCSAGGVGPARFVTPPSIGRWLRSFDADCKLNSSNGSRMFRGTVKDKFWTGKWEVMQYDFTNGNDLNLPWCP